MKSTIVVGLSGSPGSGKSTGAAYIFSKLKMLGIDAELVTEFAKDCVWDEAKQPFNNSAYMFGNQYYRISRCLGKVDVIVTDSPLPLAIVYNTDTRLGEAFFNAIIDVWKSFDTLNYFIKRVKPYNANGRNQAEEESDTLSKDILSLYDTNGIPTRVFSGCESCYDMIVEDILYELKERKNNK